MITVLIDPNIKQFVVVNSRRLDETAEAKQKMGRRDGPLSVAQHTFARGANAQWSAFGCSSIGRRFVQMSRAGCE